MRRTLADFWTYALALALLAAILLGGCSSAPVGPSDILVNPALGAIRNVSEGVWDIRMHSWYVGPAAITFPVRLKGNAKVVTQWPAKPHLIFDGDAQFIVEPLDPASAAWAQEQINLGIVQIRNAGAAGSLSPAGTIRGTDVLGVPPTS